MRYADTNCSIEDNVSDGEHGYIIKGPCINCRAPQEVTVPSSELFAYRQGAHIQNAMPSVTSAEREFLLSGICGSCWQTVTQ